MNILDSLKGLVTDELVFSIASTLGEDSTAVTNTLQQSIPTVLAGLLNIPPKNVDNVERLLKDSTSHDTSIENLLDMGVKAHSMGAYFKSFNQTIFGDKKQRVLHILENESAADEESIPSILKIATSMVATFLGKKMNEENLNLSSILNWIGKDKEAILAAAPRDIQNALGISAGAWNPISENSTSASTITIDKTNKLADTNTVVQPPQASGGNNNMKWLWPLILLAALAAGIFWVLNKNGGNESNEVDTAEVYVNEENTETGDDTVEVQESVTIINGALDDDGNWIATKGDTIDIKLQDGTEIITTKGSVTDKLYNFLREPEADANKNNPENWFVFDDILFKSGSSKLKRGSEDQIKNVIAVLKAFPSATIKLGGYTDNTGSEEANMKISDQRAKAVHNKMINMGADRSSFDSDAHEGYGPQFPVCPANDTPECKAQNRRIAVVVTGK